MEKTQVRAAVDVYTEVAASRVPRFHVMGFPKLSQVVQSHAYRGASPEKFTASTGTRGLSGGISARRCLWKLYLLVHGLDTLQGKERSRQRCHLLGVCSPKELDRCAAFFRPRK